MDINELLQGVECSCGKFHSCDIEYVYIADGAISKLKNICTIYNKILIVADENTFAAAGEKTEKALAGKTIRKIIFDGNNILIPNEDAISEVESKLEDSDLIVGIGSGVIQDLCKYVSFKNNIPYMVVATAPSMDGYASDGAAMILGGMKETVKAGLPRAIIADTEVLKNAPIEMIKAGYGDIIGKYSALNDWKLSHIINDEYFCPYIYNTTMDMVKKTLGLAEGLIKRDAKSVGVLMEALVIVGILMSFATSSRPASGSEHHLSHFFEIVGIVAGEEYLPHGIDVAFSTVVTAQIRERILKTDFPDVQYRETREEYEAKMEDIYRQVASGCIKLQDKVGNYAKNRIELYKSKEQEIRQILAEMPSADEIKKMLELAKLDIATFYNLYSGQKINNAVKYAKDLKDRYTVLWINYDLFGGIL
ncbi:MAG: sn-glycerol-1-phosphate dehydrogenase [Ruminococcaceae bacterium]|nr:sn-glycerol-1-phosphate dehydrogenase [Oscillospiraceae bacterium]